ncbi:methionyl-tRNA formyltransferase [Oscillospiraceae bacterium MB08-C2-2]|nr:methionyl-tRNA formyltransferase [Oscillospiraceae bacterium MB08-C2-2]
MGLRIVFMGTPDFAATCLARLLEEGREVVGVFSQPDRPKGRGHKLAPPPVKELALAHEIPVYQPTALRDGKALELLKELAPDVIAVVAYGRILPGDILELPPLGCVNVHASLLPRWRGAAPIQWSILAGDEKTGVATMAMDAGMDTGDILLTEETPIDPEETAGELFERLAPIGAALLSQTLDKLEAGNCPRFPQPQEGITYASMLQKEMGELDFSKPARELHNQIRGLNPSPGAFVRSGDKVLKVLRSAVLPQQSGKPGTLLDKRRLVIACGEGALELLTVCPPGKPPMDGSAFLNGSGLTFFLEKRK